MYFASFFVSLNNIIYFADMMQNDQVIVSLQDVSIERDTNQILSDVSFELSEAEFVYLIGKSGAGKSTLMKGLFGLLPISSGKASVLSFDLASLSMSNIYSYRRKVGMIFQDFKLFEHWSVYENYDFVLKATDWHNANDRKQRIEEVATQLNLEDSLNSNILAMSGGEQQKVAIGRSLLNEPKLLLADEPTGNLDPENAEMIIELLHNLGSSSQTSILLTTHHHQLIDNYPARVIYCEDGSVRED